jgi:hypothetical protein
MNKYEMIIFSILAVLSVLVMFDFITYTFKSVPKRAILSKLIWKVGLLSIVILVYWYMNGMRFI